MADPKTTERKRLYYIGRTRQFRIYRCDPGQYIGRWWHWVIVLPRWAIGVKAR